MKKMKRMSGEPTMVRLVWDDAWSGSIKVGAESSHYEQEWICVEVGFLKSITEREVVICRHWSRGMGEGDQIQYDACMRVPRGIVKSITVLALSHRLRESSGRSVSKSSSRRKSGTAK
ncbi:hypothetical protein LCGC14_1848690 [marine sediment metagenome]|uniref:Uncharacterized protein n=1 Tax=marine sediment metagenome TaxID=412755 RepID=A0A0F9GAY0_9ZZZZ